MHMDGLLWPMALILLGAVLLVMELFIPSGGALGVFAGLAFIAAIGLGFYENPYAGTLSLLIVAVILPVALAMFTHWWPKTPIGRRILLRRSPREEEALVADDEDQQLRLLIGKRGRAKTKMLPSGAVEIDGHTYDATTQGLAIEIGDPVEVIAYRMHRLVVRSVENDATPRPSSPSDVLSQPAEQFGISPFEDPLV
jgi:membrane-bound ClpP family serine protease